MRGAVWLMLVGAICLGCGKKEEVAVPNVALDPNGPQGTIPLTAPPPPTFELNYGKLWNPKGGEKADPVAAVKTVVAQRYFAKHQTEFLAPATIGSFVTLTQGGHHGVAVPAALAAVYPEVAEKFETRWQDGISVAVTNIGGPAVLDFSSRGGSTASRVLVLRVENGDDAELRTRFGEYLERLEKAVRATGATINHQRVGNRSTGALSDLRYEVAEHIGFVRSVVVRKFDETDVEFGNLILGDAAKGQDTQLFKTMMGTKQGPFLVVALRHTRQ